MLLSKKTVASNIHKIYYYAKIFRRKKMTDTFLSTCDIKNASSWTAINGTALFCSYS